MTSVENMEDLRRLRWQCRRGLLELDILFTRFLNQYYQELAPPHRTDFRKLLAEPDTRLLAWIQGQETPPNELKNIIEILSQ